MRIDVRKFLFVGLEEQRDQFFKTAQHAGIIHFIDTSEAPYKNVSEDVERVLAAIKAVRELPVMEQEEAFDLDRADEIVNTILMLRETIDKREEQTRILNLEIARIAVFGDFVKDDLDYIESQGHRKIQFYCGAQGIAEELTAEPNLIHVSTDFGLDYFVGIHKEPKQYPGLVEMKIDKPVGDLIDQRNQLETQRREAEESLKKLACYEDFLHDVLKLKLNQANLTTAQGYAERPLENALFAVTGWVPENKMNQLQPLLSDLSIHSEEIAIEPWDVIPTYLENDGVYRIGEDLVHIYDTPAPIDNDPSLWVLGFFALFFAMIVGDGGYGLVFLGISVYLRQKYKKVGEVGHRFFNLVTILAFACILWGINTSSFFGVSLGPDNPLRKVSLITWLSEKKAEYYLDHKGSVYEYWLKRYPELPNIRNGGDFLRLRPHDPNAHVKYEVLAKFSDQIFLEMVLVIAIIHLILSLARYSRRNWAAFGWILLLVGAFLYIPHTFLDTITFVQYVLGMSVAQADQTGWHLIVTGFTLAILLALVQHRWHGLHEPMMAIQIFADVMSYLRIYALGLAGMMVAETLNEMAAGLPLLLATVLVILGHCVNMVLAIAGGIIHGLRLNFLEWYHYSFIGGGKPFHPLRFLKLSSAAMNKQD